MVVPQRWHSAWFFQLPGKAVQTRSPSTGGDSHGRMRVPHGLLLLLPLLRLLLRLLEIAQGHIPSLLLPCRARSIYRSKALRQPSVNAFLSTFQPAAVNTGQPTNPRFLGHGLLHSANRRLTLRLLVLGQLLQQCDQLLLLCHGLQPAHRKAVSVEHDGLMWPGSCSQTLTSCWEHVAVSGLLVNLLECLTL